MAPSSRKPKAGEESTKVVYAALAGNVLVALAKFAATVLSGSSAMLTEAIHSSADSANQLILLLGNKRSRVESDESHPFGYGMEIYFWTFVVAVMVLLAGGVASIYEGVAQLNNPQPIERPLLSLGVLLASAVFEGSSFAVGYRAFKRVVRGREVDGEPMSMWRFIEISKDPNLYETLLEDSAALIGIGIAIAGVVASAYFKLLIADGIASIAIGLLLVADSVIIARATRSLIAGESAARPVVDGIHDLLRTHAPHLQVSTVATLQLGPETILVAFTIAPDPATTLADTARHLHEMTARLKAFDAWIAHVLFRME
ncbi:MAG: cation diffusion facilitator family transporter [Pseudomonadota bacterium]